MQVIKKSKTNVQMHGCNVLPIKTLKGKPKTIENRKRDSAWGFSRWGHRLKKSEVRKAQISKAFVPPIQLISALRSWLKFFLLVFIILRNLSHNLFILFPIGFGINSKRNWKNWEESWFTVFLLGPSFDFYSLLQQQKTVFVWRNCLAPTFRPGLP